jgi:two-component system, LytTR family, sensor kinase
MKKKFKFSLAECTVYFVVWTLFGLYMFSQGIVQKAASHDPTPWTHHLTSWMVGVYLWFLLTPVILWLGRRFPFERERWMRWVAIHLALSILIAIVDLSLESAILRVFGVFPTIMTSFIATLAFLLVIAFHQNVITYWTLLGVQYALDWYHDFQERKQEALRLELRSSQLETQLTQAHLSALKMQIQPHFLFNTLNAIMVLVRQQRGREAEEMLSRLSDLLRCVLDDIDAQEVPLRRELEYVQLYLSIEEVRFQDRLRVEIAAAPEALDATVPHMVLQPLIENAIRHGIGQSASAGTIRISAYRVNQMLEMKVEDDGPGLPAVRAGETHGIGLTNTRARIQQLYGNTAHLTVENGEKAGVVATLVFPCRIVAAPAEAEFKEAHALQHTTR